MPGQPRPRCPPCEGLGCRRVRPLRAVLRNDNGRSLTRSTASFGAILHAVGTPRGELIAEVVVALTDTLRDDFDVADLLYTLTTACVALLDVDTAGVLLVDEQGGLIPVAATHDGSEHLERLQIMTREGPCVDAVRAAESVHSVDLDRDAGRWPEFARQARAEGFLASHAEPMALRTDVVGGLGLFRNRRGAVPEADQRIAHFLATAAAVGITHRRAHRGVETVKQQLEHALQNRIVIEQAKGFPRRALRPRRRRRLHETPQLRQEQQPNPDRRRPSRHRGIARPQVSAGPPSPVQLVDGRRTRSSEVPVHIWRTSDSGRAGSARDGEAGTGSRHIAADARN